MPDCASWRSGKASLRRQQGATGLSGKEGFWAEGPEQAAGLERLRNSEISVVGTRSEGRGEGWHMRSCPPRQGLRGSVLSRLEKSLERPNPNSQVRRLPGKRGKGQVTGGEETLRSPDLSKNSRCENIRSIQISTARRQSSPKVDQTPG